MTFSKDMSAKQLAWRFWTNVEYTLRKTELKRTSSTTATSLKPQTSNPETINHKQQNSKLETTNNKTQSTHLNLDLVSEGDIASNSNGDTQGYCKVTGDM